MTVGDRTVGAAFDWAFLDGRARRPTRHPFPDGAAAVWVLSSFALWFWHLPKPYDWSLNNPWAHAGEHLCFFLTAPAFWSLVLAPYARRQLDYGSSLLFVGTLGMQMGLLGAIRTFATRPVYLAHAHTTVAWGLSLLGDQQLAGLIMWVPAGLVCIGAMAALFVAWLHDAECKAPTAMTTGRRAPALQRADTLSLLLLVLVLSAATTRRRPRCGRSALRGARADRP